MNAHLERATELLAVARTNYCEALEKVHKHLRASVIQDPKLREAAVTILKMGYVDPEAVVDADFQAAEQPEEPPTQIDLVAGEAAIGRNEDPGLVVVETHSDEQMNTPSDWASGIEEGKDA